jgi:hypothetical protein
MLRSVRGLQISPFKVEGTDKRYVEEVLITAGDDVNQVRAFAAWKSEDDMLCMI